MSTWQYLILLGSIYGSAWGVSFAVYAAGQNIIRELRALREGREGKQ